MERSSELTDKDYVLHTYESYEQYRNIQIKGNKRKISKVWTNKETIDLIVEELDLKDKQVMCHGARNGSEVQWFKEAGCISQGTDISDSASEYGLIQWDFHEENPVWEQMFDVVYTNSWDHAYDPQKAFTAWMKQIHPDHGRLVIEHSRDHSVKFTNELDPFGVSLNRLLILIEEWGFKVEKIIETLPENVNKSNILVIKNV